MTEQLYLHVGAPKSGTTYLQRLLDGNRDTLAAGGALVVGERHLDRVHAGMVVREDPRLQDLGPRARSSWQRLVESIRSWPGPKAVLSYELFAGASAEQAQRALADLAGIDVHVVITARDFGKAVPSAWQERLKFALTTPLEEWEPRPESAGPRAEWGWRTMDPAGVADRWGATLAPDHVHVVTVPPAGTADRDELWHRFAAACDIGVPGLDLDLERVNESMGVVAAELLRRVNEKVTAPLDTSREQARWLRDTLAHGVLSTLGSEPIGITDEQYDDALARSEDSIKRICDAGYAVHGDVEDLRATRPSGRTPGQAGDAELLDAATETIAKLLVLLRERTQPASPQPAPAGPAPAPTRSTRTLLATAGKRLVQRAAAVSLRQDVERLEARLAAAQAELQEQRALQLRVGELTDLVAELLLPDSTADVPADRVESYRRDSL
jgi:hypothetical protein